MINEESVNRSSLIYSIKNDRVYYFSCPLFSNTLNLTGFIDGINDWKYLDDTIKSHEFKKDLLKTMQQ